MSLLVCRPTFGRPPPPQKLQSFLVSLLVCRFVGQISVKVSADHIAQNIVRHSNLFCGLCLMVSISFSQALEVFQGQICVKINVAHVAQNMVHCSNFFGGYA